MLKKSKLGILAALMALVLSLSFMFGGCSSSKDDSEDDTKKPKTEENSGKNDGEENNKEENSENNDAGQKAPAETYEQAAEKYMRAYLNGDFETMLKYEVIDFEKYCEAEFEYKQEYYDYADLGEYYAKLADDESVTTFDEYIQYLTDRATEDKLDNFEIKRIEALDSEKLSGGELFPFIEEIVSDLKWIDAEDLVDTDEITVGYKVNVEIEYTYENDNGKKKTVIDEDEVIVLQYKNSWRTYIY